MITMTAKQAHHFFSPISPMKRERTDLSPIGGRLSPNDAAKIDASANTPSIEGVSHPQAKLEAVLYIARRFGPVWLQTPSKTGYPGSHGSKDATRDEATIRGWLAEHPEGVPALLTGEASGIVALDVDIKNGRNGLDTLEELGIAFHHPVTPTAHTPSGGLHMLFRWPGRFVRSTCDVIGPGLEVKADRAWVTLPPGPGRSWDPHLGIDTPVAPLPAWMFPPETARMAPTPVSKPARSTSGLTRYGEAAFDGAVTAVMHAPSGAQETTLNSEAYSLGQLVAGGEIPERLAIDGLNAAARRMPSYDQGRPWSAEKLAQKIKRALAEGMAFPRRAA
jgi:hypothetical protein